MTTGNYAKPTLLCAAYAAMKLLEVGAADQAEDTLASAFGNAIHRCKGDDGRTLMKITISIDANDDERRLAKQCTKKFMDYMYPLPAVEPPAKEPRGRRE